MCAGCAELREQLDATGVEVSYYSLDHPDCEYNPKNAHSLKIWREARAAMMEAATYRAIGEPLPILLHVYGDPVDEVMPYNKLRVLDDDGNITLAYTGIVPQPVQKVLI